ncbi:MAG: molybdopterin-dependent oxidoreductase [Anaerolineales bacterium]|jgi:DMSO/TMAO reductase YedYZ molybdopterin-dependent catalytic subunit
MKPKRLSIFGLSLLVVISLSICSCAPKVLPAPASSGSAGTVLKVVSPNGTHDLTLADLKALPLTQGMAGIKDSAGVITLPANYGGVSLKDLLAQYKIPFDGTMGITLSAKDGYSMTYSYDQVTNADFTAYDPATGNELSTHEPLTAILAYEKDGKPLDPTDEGPLRLMVVSAKNDQVVDGHWTVKWINELEVKPVGAAWILHLHGAISEPVDRSTFQSCAAPGCHGASWKDEYGQTWTGVPLWLLVGQVDDSNSHGAMAFNDALADAGYTVQVVSSEGTTVDLNSKVIKRNNNILVAYTVNGADLPQQYYPLRLVGSGLQDSQMIGKVQMIQLQLPSATATPTAGPSPSSGPVALAITGAVNQNLNLTDADLHAMPVVTVSTTAPKQSAAQNFSGVLLSDLFNKAGVKAGATTAVFTASDGYSTEVSLSDIDACSDCMLAFNATPGSYSAVMPGMEGPNWTKDVIKIQIK